MALEGLVRRPFKGVWKAFKRPFKGKAFKRFSKGLVKTFEKPLKGLLTGMVAPLHKGWPVLYWRLHIPQFL